MANISESFAPGQYISLGPMRWNIPSNLGKTEPYFQLTFRAGISPDWGTNEEVHMSVFIRAQGMDQNIGAYKEYRMVFDETGRLQPLEDHVQTCAVIFPFTELDGREGGLISSYIQTTTDSVGPTFLIGDISGNFKYGPQNDIPEGFIYLIHE